MIDLAGMHSKNKFSLSSIGVRNTKNMAPIQINPNKNMRKFNDSGVYPINALYAVASSKPSTSSTFDSLILTIHPSL